MDILQVRLWLDEVEQVDDACSSVDGGACPMSAAHGIACKIRASSRQINAPGVTPPPPGSDNTFLRAEIKLIKKFLAHKPLGLRRPLLPPSPSWVQAHAD